MGAFHGGELLLKLKDVEGAARAGAETFLFGVEGLFREFVGAARGGAEGDEAGEGPRSNDTCLMTKDGAEGRVIIGWE